jgi:hypothetical protein
MPLLTFYPTMVETLASPSAGKGELDWLREELFYSLSD